LLVLTLGWVLASAGSAYAEKVKTNQSTRIYSRPGEQAKVVLKVKSGQAMTVIAKEGRWLKVRVQGRTGYVPRSKVDLPDNDEIVRNTRRRPFVDGRGTKRGFGGEEGPDDRVGADATEDTKPDDSGDDAKGGGGDEEETPKKPPPKHAPPKHHDDDEESDDDGGKATKHAKKPPKVKDEDEDEPKIVDDDSGGGGGEEAASERPVAHVTKKTPVFSERDKESEESFTARPKDILYPEETKGKWTFVSTDEGDAGWVQTSDLDMDDGGGGGGSHKRTIDLRARAGVTLINQGMRTAGSMLTVPDNYNIGTSALSLALGGMVLYPYGPDYMVGGELAYDVSKAIPGIAYMGTNTSFTVHNLNVRAVGGYDLHKKSGMMILARLGFRYQAFLVSDVIDFTKNTAKLPSEVMKAPTIGAGLTIPKLTDKIGLKFTLDAILLAGITQTKNLEDGANPSEKGICLGGVFTYKWKKGFDLQGTYDLNYASVDFGAPMATSMRGHTGTGVSRTDIFHTVTFGITAGF
jgi:hypothetical protein